MNRIKTILLGAVAVAGASTMTSCLSDNDDNTSSTVQLTYANCFNAVTDRSTGEVNIFTGPKYTFTLKTFANGTSTLKITMTNVKLADGESLISLDLPELPVTVPTDITKPNTVSGRDIVPTNMVSSEIVFDYINVKFLLRYLENNRQSFVYAVEYSVNGKYNVVTFPTTAFYYARTTSAPADGGTPFVTTDPRYAVTFNPDKKTATIDITGAKFIENMPAMNMTFGNVPFGCVGNSIEMNAESLTPTIQGVEYPGYPITSLRSKVTPAEVGSLSFTCTPERLGAFNVGVQLYDILTKEQAGI